MKITGNEAIFKQLVARETGHTDKPVKGAFNALLNQAARTESEPGGEAVPLQAPGSIKGVSLNPLVDVNSLSIPDRAENFLNLLDSYRDMLASPDVSLKEIGPVVENSPLKNNVSSRYWVPCPPAMNLEPSSMSCW